MYIRSKGGIGLAIRVGVGVEIGGGILFLIKIKKSISDQNYRRFLASSNDLFN